MHGLRRSFASACSPEEEPIVYLSDGKAYRVVSAGPDGQFSPDSKKLGAKQGDFGDDLILDSGEFVRPTGTDI